MTGLCKVGALLEQGTLRPGDRRYLADQLANPAVPATALARALTLEGHPVGQSTVKDHRADRCACARAKGTP